MPALFTTPPINFPHSILPTPSLSVSFSLTNLLQSPIPLDQPTSITGHADHISHRAQEPNRSSHPIPGLIRAHAKLDMSDADDAQCGQGTGQEGAVAAVEFDDGGGDECQGDELGEVCVAASGGFDAIFVVCGG